MKNSVTLLPADTYIVINKSLLNENDKVTLNMLYMPIIGNTAVTLYNILYNESIQVIDNNTLVAITLLIAQSNPKEKNILIDLVMNFLDNN